MTNPDYRLKARIDGARAAADVSVDPTVHALNNALEGVAGAERYRIERDAWTAAHGTADPDSFEPWSAVSKPGEVSRGPYC
jgi:hypothetical protein